MNLIEITNFCLDSQNDRIKPLKEILIHLTAFQEIDLVQHRDKNLQGLIPKIRKKIKKGSVMMKIVF